MQFIGSAAFDAKTRADLERLWQRPVDIFGQPIQFETPLSHTRVLNCLREEPMRVRQIMVRLQAKRALVEAACEELIARRMIECDGEAFYSLKTMAVH